MRGPRRIVAALRRAVRGRRAHLGSSAVRAAEKPPPVAQRQRRQQLDRLRLGDRDERGCVRTGRVRRAECRRSPRSTRGFPRIPAPLPAANRGRTLRPDIRDRGSDPGPGSPGGGRCRPRAATTASPRCPRRLRRRTAGRDRLAPPGDRSRQVRSVRPVAAVGQTAARHRRGPASPSRARCAMPRTTTDDRVPGLGTGPLTSPDGKQRAPTATVPARRRSRRTPTNTDADLHGRKRCPSSVSTRSGIPSGTWTG